MAKIVDGWEAVKDGDHYVGKYTWPDGSVFEGRAVWTTEQEIVHDAGNGYKMTVKQPVMGHYQYNGTWFSNEDRPEDKGKKAGAPIIPPDPDNRGIKAALDN